MPRKPSPPRKPRKLTKRPVNLFLQCAITKRATVLAKHRYDANLSQLVEALLELELSGRHGLIGSIDSK